MERWLSKSRVLICFCVALLMAALNRRDPMVYGLFLFLLVISSLGFAIPWLSLRAMRVRLDASMDLDIHEGADGQLNLHLERRTFWPAFMVAVETEWEWAGRRTVLRQIIPVIRSGRLPDLSGRVRFACRGHYQLKAVRLSSGFPLGLVRVSHTLSPAQMQVKLRVLPRPQAVHWPLPWGVTDDALGERTTRRLGQSFELGMLRNYQYGDAVGRVNWRASARAGELVIQHFQHNGTIRLRLVVARPQGAALGDPHSAGEQAIRLAAGVCEAAHAHGVQLAFYESASAAPLHGQDAIERALAEALPQPDGLQSVLAAVVNDAAPGEQVAVVVAAGHAVKDLLPPLELLARKGCTALVCIAQGRRHAAADLQSARTAQALLRQAGFTAFTEAA